MTLAISIGTATKKVTVSCPSCQQTLPNRLRKEYVTRFKGKYSVCPWCGEWLFKQGKGSVILAEDQYTVDTVIAMINDFVTRRDGHFIEESSARERAYVYSLIEFAMKQMNGAEADIGLTSHSYLVAFTEWLLKKEPWCEFITTIRQIHGHRQRLMADFYEEKCAGLGVETPRIANIRKRLDEKLRVVGWKK
jgi:hypothetical protein